MTDITSTLDVRGELCPLPIVRASQAIKGLAYGLIDGLEAPVGAASALLEMKEASVSLFI